MRGWTGIVLCFLAVALFGLAAVMFLVHVLRISTMKILILSVALLGLTLGGCQAAGTNPDPYTNLDKIVLGDDTAVKSATVVIQDAIALGVDPTQAVQAGTVLYTGETTFILATNTVTIPLVLVPQAAPTLAPGAVTLVQLQGDMTTLAADNQALHVATTKGSVAAEPFLRAKMKLPARK